MRSKYLHVLIAIICTTLLSCSVISREVRQDVVQAPPFNGLVSQADAYIGQTVVLGGYILTIENLADETVLTVLQVPLRIGDEPRGKDVSEGRFKVSHSGFLDPAVYSPNRRITVAGTVLGQESGTVAQAPYTFLKIASREIHLWEDYTKWRYPPYHYDWHHPLFWPHHRRHFHHGYRYYW